MAEFWWHLDCIGIILNHRPLVCVPVQRFMHVSLRCLGRGWWDGGCQIGGWGEERVGAQMGGGGALLSALRANKLYRHKKRVYSSTTGTPSSTPTRHTWVTGDDNLTKSFGYARYTAAVRNPQYPLPYPRWGHFGPALVFFVHFDILYFPLECTRQRDDPGV